MQGKIAGIVVVFLVTLKCKRNEIFLKLNIYLCNFVALFHYLVQDCI